MISRGCFPSSFRPCTLRIIAATRPGSQSLEFTASVKPGKIWEYLSSSKVKKVAFSQILSARFFVFSRMTRILRSNLICEDWAPQLCRADIGSRAEYFVTTTTALPKSRKNVEVRNKFAGIGTTKRHIRKVDGFNFCWSSIHPYLGKILGFKISQLHQGLTFMDPMAFLMECVLAKCWEEVQ